MSAYTQTVFFTAKDALISGNPAKLIKGAEVDPELAAIAVAIASKYDSSNLFANPSGTIGLANVVGSATTAMRSDAAPPLSQAIVPTWTGVHTFSATPVFSSNITVGGATFSGLANPSGTAGLTAVNGSAATAMRSDGAPAISQAIAPTWTGTHTFNASSAVSSIIVNGKANTRAVVINGISTTGQSYGLLINAGTNGTDQPLLVLDQTGLKTLFAIQGTGAMQFGNATDNPAYSFIGTGTATFGGAVTATGAVTGSNFSGFANPSGSAGLTAVNGSAITAMRSDGAPAISQSITPTWSGAHTFSAVATFNGSNPTIVASAATPVNRWTETSQASGSRSWQMQYAGGALNWLVANDAFSSGGNFLAVTRSGSTVATVSFGNATDNPTYSFLGSGAISGVGSGLTSLNGSNISSGMVATARLGSGTANSTTFLRGDSTWQTAAATTTGTFTGTFTGFTSANTGTCTWTLTGNTVTLFMPASLAASNTTAFTMTGLPAAIQPATLTQSVALTGDTQNNSTSATGAAAVFSAASGTVTFHNTGGAANWTASGNKGWSVGASVTYSVQ